MIGRRAAPDAAVLDRHTDMVSHRGPDGRGTIIRGAVGLGHRRLSVLDLSTDGLQPMWHRSIPICIVYNGEIYNYLELRDELAGRGHSFTTCTDTEVVLAAYLQWGAECVQRFNGMWAFAILDERSGQLFCSRDRFGVKPLYWLETPNIFAFGSEIRQLLPFSERRTANAELVRDFLVSGLSDHTEGTFHAGIHQLQGGHNLTYDLATHRYQIERFYSLAETVSADRPIAAADVAARLKALLTDAIRLRMRSDVRVGTCLSGGLDSSAIAAIASGLNLRAAEPFHAITAISEQEENSEEAYAARVASFANLKWIQVRPTFDDFAQSIDALVDTQEEPFGGPSVAMQYFVMKAAKADGVTVLLDGQGADESLFGYDRHLAPWLRDRLRSSGVAGLGRAISAAASNNRNVSAQRLVAMLVGSFVPSLIRRAMVPRMPGARFRPALPSVWARHVEHLDDSVQVQLSDIQATSLPMLLRYEDRNSMRHSIETRLPFLDYRVVELALSMDVDVKIRSGWSKWPLRSAMDGDLPAEIVWRKRKLGFEAPDRVWLDAYRPIMKAAVAKSQLLAEYFHLPVVIRTYDRLDRNLAWRIYCVAAWERQAKIAGGAV